MKREVYTDVIPVGYRLYCDDMVLIGVEKVNDECLDGECSISN